MKYAVSYEQGETTWGASVPDLGVFAVADTLDEVRHMVAEAVEFHIESLKDLGFPVPPPTTVAEYVEVAA